MKWVTHTLERSRNTASLWTRNPNGATNTAYSLIGVGPLIEGPHPIQLRRETMKIKHKVWRTGEYINGQPVVNSCWDYDDEFQRALYHGEISVRRANLNQWRDRVRSSWTRASLPWEKKEDDLILSFMDKFEGRGKRNDIILCLAWVIDRTTTSISTRLNTLKKDKCLCCGK